MVAVLVVVCLLACWTGWSRLFLISSSLCVPCCGVPARHNRLQHSDCVPCQAEQQREAASSAASHAAIHSSSTITTYEGSKIVQYAFYNVEERVMLNVKLGPRRNYHEGRAAIRHYANQPARPL